MTFLWLAMDKMTTVNMAFSEMIKYCYQTGKVYSLQGITLFKNSHFERTAIAPFNQVSVD